jgi:hypothetical protein
MLVKINETGSIFHDAIEFIKVTRNIKTASKTAVVAILEFQGLIERVNLLEKMLYEERIKVSDFSRNAEKTKQALEYLKSI